MHAMIKVVGRGFITVLLRISVLAKAQPDDSIIIFRQLFIAQRQITLFSSWGLYRTLYCVFHHKLLTDYRLVLW